MDANAYLRKQGWKGSGHSLDGYGRGIKKPLLIAHKQDQLGLGKKKAAHNIDDQWWMRAFDESLQNIGTGQQSTLTQVRTKGINRGGLYGFFVKGEGLVGTISNTEESSSAEASSTSTAPSGASTPPTSASDDGNTTTSTEECGSSLKPLKLAKKTNKRKRADEQEATSHKKVKSRKEAPKTGHVQSTVTTVLGTFNGAEIVKIHAVIRVIKRKAKATVELNEKKGVYGPYTTSRGEKGCKEGESHQLSEDLNSKEKNLTAKKAKIRRQKNMREAKVVLMKGFVLDAILKGDLPNPERWTKDEVLANYNKISRALSEVKKAGKESRRQAKEAKKLSKKEQKELAKERAAESKAQKDGEAPKFGQAFVDQVAKLSLEKRADYEKRATEKDQTLEEYIQRRMEKKDAKRVAKDKKV